MHEREDEWEALREAALRNQAFIHTPLPPSMLKPAPPRMMSPFELSEASEAEISNGLDHSLQAVASAGQAMDDTSITSAEDQEDEHGDLVSDCHRSREGGLLMRPCDSNLSPTLQQEIQQPPLLAINLCVSLRSLS